MEIEETQPLSSDDECHAKPITLESVMRECGPFGRYQIIHSLFLCLFAVESGMYNFYYVFGAAEPQYQCIIPDDVQRNFHVENLPSQCSYFLLSKYNGTNTIYPCTNWTYDRKVFGKTFTEETNLVCTNSIRRALLGTVLQIGAFTIFLTGKLTDIIGRRSTLRLIIYLLLITSLITQTSLQFLSMPNNLKYALLLINQCVSGIDPYLVSFVLLIELTTSKYATLAGELIPIGYAVGEIIVAGMAYICRDWLLLKWAMTMYIVTLLPYLYFVPESPYWLLTKYHYDELENLLRRIATFNQKSHSKWLSLYRGLIDVHRKEKDANTKTKIKLSYWSKTWRLITHIPIMSKFIISGALGLVTSYLYFNISYNLGAMGQIDPYLNIVIGAFVEIFGYITASLCMIPYGRKPIFILFLILTTISFILTPLIYDHHPLIVVVLAQFGKFSISAAVSIPYIFIPESFPTSIRGTGLGFFVLTSRIGATLAPIISALIAHDDSSTNQAYYLYAILTICCALLTLLLPETRNVPLTDKIDYNTNKKEMILPNT